MLKYAVCEIGGKQYKVIPNQAFDVDFNDKASKSIEANVLLLMENGTLRMGRPHLKEKIVLKTVGNVVGRKIRVSKYHAKANYRKVRGFRPKLTRVILD